MCKCCEEIEFWKKAKKEELKKGIAESKLFSRIAIYTWRKGERKIKGNQSGTIGSKAYDLNYCPMCRKKIKLGGRNYVYMFERRKRYSIVLFKNLT